MRKILFILFSVLCLFSCSKEDDEILNNSQQSFLSMINQQQTSKIYCIISGSTEQETNTYFNVAQYSCLIDYTQNNKEYTYIGVLTSFDNENWFVGKEIVINDAICITYINNIYYGKIPVFISKNQYTNIGLNYYKNHQYE